MTISSERAGLRDRLDKLTPPDNRDAIVYPIVAKLDQRGVDLATVVAALERARLDELKFVLDRRRRAGIHSTDRIIAARRKKRFAAYLALGVDQETAIRLTERTPLLRRVVDPRTPEQVHLVGSFRLKQKPAKTWIETARKAITNAGATADEAHWLLIGVRLVRIRPFRTRVKPVS